MNIPALKAFAPTRRQIIEAVTLKLNHALTARTPDYLDTYARQVAALRTLEQEDRTGLIERVASVEILTEILTVGQQSRKIMNQRTVFLRLLGLQQFNVYHLPANCRKVADIWCREERPVRLQFVERKQELLGAFVQMGADFRNELLSR